MSDVSRQAKNNVGILTKTKAQHRPSNIANEISRSSMNDTCINDCGQSDCEENVSKVMRNSGVKQDFTNGSVHCKALVPDIVKDTFERSASTCANGQEHHCPSSTAERKERHKATGTCAHGCDEHLDITDIGATPVSQSRQKGGQIK